MGIRPPLAAHCSRSPFTRAVRTVPETISSGALTDSRLPSSSERGAVKKGVRRLAPGEAVTTRWGARLRAG